MFAYIKLISSGKFTTVGINQIKKYKKSKPNKIFEVKIKGEYHQCLIGATHESKEELDDIIKNGGRIRFPPAALFSDLSETDDQACLKKKSTGPTDNKTRDILNKKLSTINKKPEESRVMNLNIEESIEENTLVSDSEESSGDSDDEETSTASVKDDKNKQDTEKDEPNKKDSEFVAENVDDELTKTIGSEESSDLIEEEHKAHDYENVEE